MAFVPLAVMAAGAVVSAVGSIYQGQAASAASGYNAQVDESNARASVQQGAEEERRVRVIGRKQQGQIRAAVGASGIQLDGSALDVLQESSANAEADALNARHNGELKASAYQKEAAGERFKSSTSSTAGYLGAASSILNAGASAYKVYGK